MLKEATVRFWAEDKRHKSDRTTIIDILKVTFFPDIVSEIVDFTFGSGNGRTGSEAEFTSAVILIIEVLFADDFGATLLKTSFAPIAWPPFHAWEKPACPFSGHIDLREILPAGRSQGSRKYIVSVV
jgi:hypothetical protein